MVIVVWLVGMGGLFAQIPPPITTRSDGVSADIAALKLDVLRLKNQVASQPAPNSDRDRIDRLQSDLSSSRAEIQRLRREIDELNSDFKKFKNLFFKHF